MKNSKLSRSVESVREFNRFYTKQIGVLDDGLLKSPFSLAEARVIYELAARGEATATEIKAELALDAGYLSRLLKGLDSQSLIEKKSTDADARASILSLSDKGRTEFAKLDRLTRDQIEHLLEDLSASDQEKLVTSMKAIMQLLEPKAYSPDKMYILRDLQPGDIGWVIHANGRLYAEEYGWDETYEARIAEILAEFVNTRDPKKERGWIAEKDGENVGSVFLVRESATAARLRVLIVDPKARGLGIGKRLVDECTRFARQAGYKKIVLWTQSTLLAARRIYSSAGYKIVGSEQNHLFGKDLVSETWESKL
jgi:DNA-binding MarR family transcriptional regulator/GNAT superfamily N-acetyltransferase